MNLRPRQFTMSNSLTHSTSIRIRISPHPQTPSSVSKRKRRKKEPSEHLSPSPESINIPALRRRRPITPKPKHSFSPSRRKTAQHIHLPIDPISKILAIITRDLKRFRDLRACIMNREARTNGRWRNVSREHEGGVLFRWGERGVGFCGMARGATVWQVRKGCNHSLTAVLRYEAGVGVGVGMDGLWIWRGKND
jgi:hypothetical protein